VQVQDHEGVDRRRFREEIVPAGAPAVLRGVAAQWPAVRAATGGGGGIADYLAARDRGAQIDMLEGPPAINGRLFYTADMSGLNFERRPGTIATLVQALLAARDVAPPPTLAAQAIDARAALPAFAEENRLDLVDPAIAPKLWIGNRVEVAAHHDMFSNIAVCVAGRRRFTLFPPDQVANLYLGPFEFTPAGTPVSLVDFNAPDYARFPRFRAAEAAALVADLAPGDALYIPHMWWHHVRSRDPLSMLANYWWDEAAPAQPGLRPIDAFVHAMLAFSGLPAEQKAAWAPMFEALVFADAAAAHLDPARAGLRGVLSDEVKARIRRDLGGLMAR
jgi:hypothetical protein